MPVTKLIAGDGIKLKDFQNVEVTEITGTGTVLIDPEITELINEVVTEMDEVASILSNYSGGLFGGHW